MSCDIKTQKGIYIHIPFCMQKCIYCDFLSAPADDKTKSSYVKALINEIALSEAGLDKNVTSIFIGGGTPSAINAEYIKDILEAVKQRYRVDGNAEITIECNPGTINSEKAYIYREAGINRISFGLQSTDDKELRMLGRIHTFEQFKNSLAIARNAGFTNINIDLMSALPGQTIESFTRVLKEAVSLNTEHISVYSLIIEEGTRLYDNIDNYPDIPDDDDDRKMYALTKEILGQAGYERYEISNYSRPGFECRHNLLYWNRGEYYGFGCSAADFIGNERYSDIRDVKKYIELNGDIGKLHENIEILTKEDAMEEFMFLGLRMMAGISTESFKEVFGRDFYEVYGDIAAKQMKQGLIKREGSRIRLTDMGIDVSNTVMAEYML